MPFTQELEEAKDKLDELYLASDQNIDNVLKQYFHAINPISDVGETLTVNLPNMNFEEWYTKALDSRGGMVGSGEMEWPIDTEERLSLQYQLIESMANGAIDVSDFAFNFTYQEGNINDSNRAFVSQVISSFHKDVLRMIKPYIQEEENRKNLPETAQAESTKPDLNLALICNAVNVLESIAPYREKIRGNNQLGIEFPEEKARLIAFLDFVEESSAELIQIASESDVDLAPDQNDEMKSWANKFWSNLQTEFKNVVSPDNVSGLVVPATLIFGLGSLGAMIGGLPGFGLGSLVGQFFAGHVKAGKLSDSIGERYKTNSKPESIGADENPA